MKRAAEIATVWLLVFLVLFAICNSAFAREVIESRIDGEFEGFDDNKVFVLTNGQVWLQVEYKYCYSYHYMPEVIIFENGGWFYMKVEGVDEVVRVERLR